jgi:hypothetical protein
MKATNPKKKVQKIEEMKEETKTTVGSSNPSTAPTVADSI